MLPDEELEYIERVHRIDKDCRKAKKSQENETKYYKKGN
jgi:hypothetical protein